MGGRQIPRESWLLTVSSREMSHCLARGGESLFAAGRLLWSYDIDRACAEVSHTGNLMDANMTRATE